MTLPTLVSPGDFNVISVEVKEIQSGSVRRKVIFGDSKRQVAEKPGEAARTSTGNPTALHLRANFGGLAGVTALTKLLSQDQNKDPQGGASSPRKARRKFCGADGAQCDKPT